MVRKNPEKSSEIIFESTVKKINNLTFNRQDNPKPNSINKQENINIETNKLLNKDIQKIDFLTKNKYELNGKNKPHDIRTRSVEFPPYIKHFKNLITYIEDQYQSLFFLQKVNLADYKENLEKIYFDNNLMLFSKYYEIRKIVEELDPETLKHLYVLKDLYLMESMKIIVDSNSYYEMKDKIFEKEPLNGNVDYIEKPQDKEIKERKEDKLQKKRKREKNKSKNQKKKNKRRRGSRSSSSSSSSSSSESSSTSSYYLRKERAKKNNRRYREEDNKYDRYDNRRKRLGQPKKFNNNRNKYNKFNEREYMIKRDKIENIDKNKSIVNNNNNYKKNFNQKSSQANTYIDTVFCDNLVMTNQNSNLNSEKNINKSNNVNKNFHSNKELPSQNKINYNKESSQNLNFHKDRNNYNPKPNNIEMNTEKSERSTTNSSKYSQPVSSDKVSNKDDITTRYIPPVNNTKQSDTSDNLPKGKCEITSISNNTTKKEESKVSILNRIKEKLKPNTNNTSDIIETIDIKSRESSIHLSPNKKKGKCTTGNTVNANKTVVSKELMFDYADLLD